jgi:hypothetical protein
MIFPAKNELPTLLVISFDLLFTSDLTLSSSHGMLKQQRPRTAHGSVKPRGRRLDYVGFGNQRVLVDPSLDKGHPTGCPGRLP